jgi:hypothetical protein
MKNTPFTYEHFTKVLTDGDILLFYIDVAVSIYCRLKGISVGARPVSPSDYKPPYSDAFSAANYAVYKVASKIGSYKPDERDFKNYLDTALGNALKDIMEEEGKSDFFDQTSKKKSKDDEPEKHSRVNVDSYRGSAGEDSEPDDESAQRRERVRQHVDDAYETMIAFIDDLPDMNRDAVYASAFGQILRPDLPNYGRNYAEIVAAAYHTTAQYIRKIASEGKKAALEMVNLRGFNKQSMDSVLIGFVPANATKTYDEVLEAVDHLDGFQQFMLLRHLADKVELAAFMDEMERLANQFKDKAKEAYWSNDRYTCALYYILHTIALNKKWVDDISIERFLMDRVFTPERKVCADLSIDDAQKKAFVESVYDRSSIEGFGKIIKSLDFRQVEDGNLPFVFVSLDHVTFFDWIGICLDEKTYPNLTEV